MSHCNACDTIVHAPAINYVTDAKNWLSQWRPDGNYKWTFGKDDNEVITKLRAQLTEDFKKTEMSRTLGYKAIHFAFTVITSETDIDGNFWTLSGSNCRKYPIVDPQPKEITA
jgi:hypothetical protein